MTDPVFRFVFAFFLLFDLFKISDRKIIDVLRLRYVAADINSPVPSACFVNVRKNLVAFIGEDIPAGSYTVTTDQPLVSITIGEYEGIYVLSKDSPIGKLTLEAGKKFSITSAVTLTKYAGLSFE